MGVAEGDEGGAVKEGGAGAPQALAEAAARHVFVWRGDGAGYGGKGGFAGVLGAGYGGEEGAGVGVAGVGEEFFYRRLLDDAPGVHDEDDVAVLRDDAEVVGDEEGGGAELHAQLAQQGEHLVLHGDI